MSSIGTLYSYPKYTKTLVVQAVAAWAGLKVDLPSDYAHYQTNKQPEFLAKFPHGKVPALDSADGFKLTEGGAIARYVCTLAPNSALLGRDEKEAALIHQWVHFAEEELEVYISLIYQLLYGYLPYSKPIHTAFTERQIRALTTLNNHLSTRTFFVGERITLADITIATFIQRGVGLTIDAPLRAQFTHVIRHMETVVNQPQLKSVYGEIKYVEKAAQYVPPAKEKKEPKPAPAPAAPKAESKPKAKPKPAEEDDDDDDEPLVREEPKAKNPLDLLPKSTFNLEDWKRAYSNKETRGPDGSLEWFYKNFDHQGFSIWRVDFKYNEELTLTFMSSNQIGGFFNRLEASRKYLFGSVGVLGQNNNSVISGVFILRGQEFLPVLDVAPDWESYAFKKIELSNEEDKSFFEAALAWDLELDGKKWVDGKNFK